MRETSTWFWFSEGCSESGSAVGPCRALTRTGRTGSHPSTWGSGNHHSTPPTKNRGSKRSFAPAATDCSYGLGGEDERPEERVARDRRRGRRVDERAGTL